MSLLPQRPSKTPRCLQDQVQALVLAFKALVVWTCCCSPTGCFPPPHALDIFLLQHGLSILFLATQLRCHLLQEDFLALILAFVHIPTLQTNHLWAPPALLKTARPLMARSAPCRPSMGSDTEGQRLLSWTGTSEILILKAPSCLSELLTVRSVFRTLFYRYIVFF